MRKRKDYYEKLELKLDRIDHCVNHEIATMTKQRLMYIYDNYRHEKDTFCMKMADIMKAVDTILPEDERASIWDLHNYLVKMMEMMEG